VRTGIQSCITDAAYGDPKHGTDRGGNNGRGYTVEELRSILAERYCLPAAEIKELITSALR
jgi:hypothetical protein